MAITTYAELQSALTEWFHRDDLNNVIPDLIMTGEKRIFREVRSRDMEATLSTTISSGVIAVPADYVELRHAYIDGATAQALIRKSPHWIYYTYPKRSSDAKPKYIAEDNGNFIFGPYPDSNYTVKGTYFKRLTSVATSANALFTSNPDLYLYAALTIGKIYASNPAEAEAWEMAYTKIRDDINAEAARGMFME